jgi:NAD(P)-dependent dehydrogenase (short-subunit alcohol dehydrogenase family)
VIDTYLLHLDTMSAVAAPPNMSDKLAGQTVLLVGGTGGVGLGVAHALLQSGASVAITGSRETKLAETLKQLRAQYPTIQDQINGYVCNLASEDVEENVASLFKQLPKLNHIVYLAGDRLPTVDLADITATSVAKSSQVRVTGALMVAKYGVSHLESSPKSSIVITSGSIASKPIPGGWALLSFIGAGLGGLTRQLAFDLAPIRVNCVAPGVVATDLWDPMGEEAKQQFFDSESKKLCTGQVGQAEDVAEAYTYLMKDCNVTGTMIDTNGGQFLK